LGKLFLFSYFRHAGRVRPLHEADSHIKSWARADSEVFPNAGTAISALRLLNPRPPNFSYISLHTEKREGEKKTLHSIPQSSPVSRLSSPVAEPPSSPGFVVAFPAPLDNSSSYVPRCCLAGLDWMEVSRGLIVAVGSFT
jgi:hypothetical protein